MVLVKASEGLSNYSIKNMSKTQIHIDIFIYLYTMTTQKYKLHT